MSHIVRRPSTERLKRQGWHRAVAGGCFALCAFAMVPGLVPDASAQAEVPLASGKKGGEPCEADVECETAVCKDGACDPCPTPEKCPPPGRCTKQKHKELDKAKSDACLKKRSCKEIETSEDVDVDCGALKALEAQAGLCVAARFKVMNECFDGGNAGHRKVYDTDVEIQKLCQSVMDEKMSQNRCFECDDFESLKNAAESACGKPTECKESKDEKKANCTQMKDRIANASACTSALDTLAERCFGKGSAAKRQEVRRIASANEGNCRDLLDYKQGKMLCQ